MPNILVIGGTGMLGRPVTFQFIKDGFKVRLLTTRLERAQQIFGDRVEYAVGNVDDPASLEKAMNGCEYVYVNLKGGPTAIEFVRVEDLGSRNIYSAAKAAGIMKIIQITGAHAYEENSDYIYIKVKVEAEKALKASGLTYTILKPSWFYESLPLFMQKGKSVYIGSGKSSFYFLAASDYANIVSRCFQTKAADNKTLTILGPEPMPIPEAMRRFMSIVHPDCTIDHLPIWLARMSATLMFNKRLKAAVKLMTFFDQHDDSEIDNKAEEADRLFGRAPMTIEQWSRVYRKIIKGV
ncbi:MAG: NAD(P)H-binding protein [FCB group bacterium]|nr:NAD(P)H-binding protein [FCB group bacterium]